MRPPWPRLALRSLVRAGPAGPGCGLGWPRQEWPRVANLLIQLHLVAFRCFSRPPNPHPDPLPEGEGIIQGDRIARFPPSRGPLEVPCPRPEHPHPMLRIDLSPMQGEVNTRLRGNDESLREDDVREQCSSQWSHGVMGSCRWFGGWAYGSLPRGQASFQGVPLLLSERPHLLA